MKEKGLALLVVVLFTFALSIMGITFLLMINVDLHELSTQIESNQALYLAEAGLQKALWYLNKGENVDKTELLGGGEYNIKAEQLPYTKITSLAKINKTKIEITADAYDNPSTPEIKDYSIIPGSWKRRNIK